MRLEIKEAAEKFETFGDLDLLGVFHTQEDNYVHIKIGNRTYMVWEGACWLGPYEKANSVPVVEWAQV